jgi:hypothetical protein
VAGNLPEDNGSPRGIVVKAFNASLLQIILLVVPAAAQTLYNNGPINGEFNALQINGGGPGSDVVSDSFTFTANSTITSFQFGEWLIPGDVDTSILASITSMPDGGTTYFSEDISLNQTNCSRNNFGFNVCTSTGLVNWNLPAGTYWFNLGDAIVTDGDPAYWDENSGVGCTSPGCPSLAVDGGIGTVPSESFTLDGNTSGTVPEPGSLGLFGSGVLAVLGLAARVLKRG